MKIIDIDYDKCIFHTLQKYSFGYAKELLVNKIIIIFSL
jgi:hypothetical protein